MSAHGIHHVTAFSSDTARADPKSYRDGALRLVPPRH